MDETVLLFFNHTLANPVFDALMGWISHKIWFSAPFLLLVLYLLIRRFARGGWVLWLILLLGIGFGDASGNYLKHALKQARPCQVVELDVRIVEAPFRHGCSGKPNGMPSNHALNFFLVAALLGLLLRSWRWFLPLASLALLVALSRVYLGVHFPSQVIVGGLLGLVMGAVFAILLSRVRWVRNLVVSEREA